ncbi:MAG: cobyric acid synthase [Clostridium sp.]|nr:cobyric acid synthase [Clostridium sp.]
MKINNKSIMIQGTASSVGKSILCTALCRIFTQDGYNVNPFKSQNMSLNSGITYEGYEIGRAQVMQAEASRKVPSVKMNPILIKPTTDRKSQIIIEGKVFDNMDAVEYFNYKSKLKNKIREVYEELKSESEIVVIEGAGSPVEINLNENDFVNMGMAKIAKSPVILVADIDRGGVFASLAGTMMLLKEDERKLVKGVIINKFRGSYDLLEPGLKMIEDIIKVPVLGVIPYFNLDLEDEDSVVDWNKFESKGSGDINIAVIKLPHISNFTDFNALAHYEDIDLRFVNKADELENPDVIIIPGSKNTIEDLEYIKKIGIFEKIKECHKNGSFIFGICGGFQMLGLKVTDSLGIESVSKEVDGLGLIKAVTKFSREKVTALSEGADKLFNCKIKGYEIHMGDTMLLDKTKYLSEVNVSNGNGVQRFDGAISENERVFGTYLHGIFDNSLFTRKLLNMIREEKGKMPLQNIPKDYWDYKNDQFDELAHIVRNNIDVKRIYEILEGGIHG